MRKHIFQGMVRAPLTEAAPSLDEMGAKERAQAGEHAAAGGLGRRL